MYSVTKRIDFCYGHRLLDYDGICKHPHGHNASAEIEVRTGTLDNRNMVCDFSDIKRAMRMTRAIRAGTVGINGYQLEPHAAFGGFQQSGLGREGGQPAIEAYTELKTVLFPLTDEMM